MRFLLMVCAGSDFEPPDSLDEQARAWIAEAEDRGLRLIGGRIETPAEATVVTTRDGEIVHLPGPRVEIDEQVLGFDVLQADSQDVVLELLDRHPMSGHGSIEVRRMLDERPACAALSQSRIRHRARSAGRIGTGHPLPLTVAQQSGSGGAWHPVPRYWWRSGA